MDFFGNIAHASVDSFVMSVNRLILNPLIVLLFALALAIFLWGVLEFLMSPENEDKKTSGKQHMFWGVVGLTIMIGVWGILKLLLNTFDIDDIDPRAGEVNVDLDL